ncbi:hypothetical protein [Fluviicola chungangensis]|uniref:Uncharacterized protein n=1 Tax=Fluviicola chungangensis TaxID=2597671 RepID=A0A556MJ08_9FLAO|nr:hypothetical protein [Fluviicola chungangensis]TSJ39907.1 hypothetical protein FO442_16490 [Fluviicola chungangensis]
MIFKEKVKEKLGIELEFSEAVISGSTPSGVLLLKKLFCLKDARYSLESFIRHHKLIDFPGNLNQIVCEKINGEVYIINTQYKLFDLLSQYKDNVTFPVL